MHPIAPAPSYLPPPPFNRLWRPLAAALGLAVDATAFAVPRAAVSAVRSAESATVSPFSPCADEQCHGRRLRPASMPFLNSPSLSNPSHLFRQEVPELVRRSPPSPIARRRLTVLVRRIESSSSDAPIYFKIVAEVPPAGEQGKSYLFINHVAPKFANALLFPLNHSFIYLLYSTLLLVYYYSFAILGCNMIRCWIRTCLALLSRTSTQWGILAKCLDIGLA